MRQLQFFSDSGHGWLRANRCELVKLNLIGLISRYSYQNGPWIYLEEDQDAGYFLEYLNDNNIEYQLNSHNSERSTIRNYPRFELKNHEIELLKLQNKISNIIQRADRFGFRESLNSEDVEPILEVLKKFINN